MATPDVTRTGPRRGRNNFIFGAALVAFTVWVMVESLRMPRYLEFEGIYAAPGFVPFILAASLCLMGISLVLTGIKQGALQVLGSTWQELKGSLGTPEMGRLGLALLLITAYVFGLLRHTHYIVATTVFLALFIAVFRQGGWKGRLLSSLAIAAITSAVVYLSFTHIFLIPLP